MLYEKAKIYFNNNTVSPYGNMDNSLAKFRTELVRQRLQAESSGNTDLAVDSYKKSASQG